MNIFISPRDFVRKQAKALESEYVRFVYYIIRSFQLVYKLTLQSTSAPVDRPHLWGETKVSIHPLRV